MTFLIPLLILGGVALASQVLGAPETVTTKGPATPGAPPPAGTPPKNLDADFATGIATLDTPTMQTFLREVSGWKGADFANGKSLLADAWKKQDWKLLRAKADDLALYSIRPAPVSEKPAYGPERANLIKLAQTLYDKTRGPTGLEDLTRFAAKAALENVSWFQIMTELTKFLPALTTEAELAERMQQYRAATEDWLSADPKTHVATAMAIKSTLVMPLSEAQRARVRQAVALETQRAERLGASPADLAAIASTAMGAGETGPVTGPVVMPPLPDDGSVPIDVPGLEAGPVDFGVPGIGA